MHNSIRLLVLVIVFQSLGCTLLVGRVTDTATANNRDTLSTSSGNRSQTAFTLSDQPNSGLASEDNLATEVDSSKLNAPLLARSTSRPAAVGLTVEEIRAERMAQSEARRQRDLRFAEVQREVAERFQQRQDDLVVVAGYSQYANTPTTADQSYGVAKSNTNGSFIVPTGNVSQANSSVASEATSLIEVVAEVADDETADARSVSSALMRWTAERPQLWMTIVVLVISGLTFPIAKHRLRWTLLRQRSSDVEPLGSDSLESQSGDTEAADETAIVATVHEESVTLEVDSGTEQAGTPQVRLEKSLSVEEQSWTSNLVAPSSEYAVDCMANWNAVDLELALEPISDKQLSVHVEQAHLPQTPIDHSPIVDSPIVDSPIVDSPIVDSPMVDSSKVNSAIVDSPMVDSAIVDASKVDSEIVDSATGQSPIGQLSLLRLPAPRISLQRVTGRAASKCERIPFNPAQCDSSQVTVQSNSQVPRGYLPAPSRKSSLALVKLPYRAKRSKCRQLICVGRNEKSNEAAENDHNVNTQTALILHSSEAKQTTSSSRNRSQVPAAPRRKIAGIVVLYDQDASGKGARRVMMVESYEITQQDELRARVVEVG